MFRGCKPSPSRAKARLQVGQPQPSASRSLRGLSCEQRTVCFCPQAAIAIHGCRLQSNCGSEASYRSICQMPFGMTRARWRRRIEAVGDTHTPWEMGALQRQLHPQKQQQNSIAVRKSGLRLGRPPKLVRPPPGPVASLKAGSDTHPSEETPKRSPCLLRLAGALPPSAASAAVLPPLARRGNKRRQSVPRRPRRRPHGEPGDRPLAGSTCRSRGMLGCGLFSSPFTCLAPALPCLQYGTGAVGATGRALAAGKDLAAVAAEKTKQVTVAGPILPCNCN